MIYEITKGSIDKEGLKDLEIRAVAVFPMDFGDSTFTSFEGGPEWLKLFDAFPQVDPMTKEPNWFIGKIHSHHNMGVFHSTTDKADLYENAPKLPIFLSLITNYKHEWDNKLAIAVEAEQKKTTWWKWKLKGWDLGDEKTEEESSTPLVTYILDCETLYENEDWFVEQLEVIATKPEPVKAYSNAYSFGRFQKVDPVQKKADDTENDMFKKITRSKMLINFAELITLGQDNDFRTAHEALSHVDKQLMPVDLPKFTEALKIYFDEEWYPTNFYDVQCEEEDVIDTIFELIEHNRTMWISKSLTSTFNELRKHYSLRTV